MGAWGEYDDENDGLWDVLAFVGHQLGLKCDVGNHSVKMKRVKRRDVKRRIAQETDRLAADGKRVADTWTGGSSTRKTVDVTLVLASYDECRQSMCDFVASNKLRVWRTAKQLTKDDDAERRDSLRAGVALRLGNTDRPWTCSGSTLAHKMSSGANPNRKLRSLDLPASIKREAHAATRRTLSRLSKDTGWRNIEHRRRALEHQLRLFS